MVETTGKGYWRKPWLLCISRAFSDFGQGHELLQFYSLDNALREVEYLEHKRTTGNRYTIYKLQDFYELDNGTPDTDAVRGYFKRRGIHLDNAVLVQLIEGDDAE